MKNGSCISLAIKSFLVLSLIGWGVNITPSIRAQTDISQTIRLDPGWNLIAFQVIPEDPRPIAVFGSLGDNFVRAWTYDNSEKKWSFYERPDSLRPEANEIGATPNISTGQAYWIYMNRAITDWKISGKAPSITPAVAFSTGWNLVGIPTGAGQINKRINMAAVLAASGANYDVILRWERTQYERFSSTNNIANAFSLFDPNKGYWVNVVSSSFSLQPKSLSTVRPDSDVEPVSNYPGPEDLKLSGSPVPLDASQQTNIVFLPGEESQTLSIANTGGGVLLWSLVWTPTDLTNVQWLTLSASQGVTTVESDIITLGVDRNRLAKGTYRGVLKLVTTAGDRVFQIAANVGELGGEWRGSARITQVNGKANSVPDVDLYMSFYEDLATPGLMRGIMESQKTVLWPVDVPLIGHITSSQGTAFNLSGGFVLPPGDQNNPPYDQFPSSEDVDWNNNGQMDDVNPFAFPIYRYVTLSGYLSKASTRDGFEIRGAYSEVIYGMRREVIRMEGTFTLSREKAKPFVSRNPVINAEPVNPPAPVIIRSTNYPAGLVVNGRVESILPVKTDMVLQDVSVTVEFQSVIPKSLTMQLISPNDVSVTLHNQADASEASFKQVSYPNLRTPVEALDKFMRAGAPSKNNWRLVLLGTGSILKSWTLRLQGQPVFNLAGRVESATGGGGIPAEISLGGFPLSQIVLANPDGTFQISRIPGIPINLDANYTGYESKNAVAGLNARYTTPYFPTNQLTALGQKLAARFQPLPVMPFPANLTDGFSTAGSATNPIVVQLTAQPQYATNFVLATMPYTGFAPLPVSFQLLGPVSSSANIQWNFGDGTTTNGVGLVNIAHTYATANTNGYSVQVGYGKEVATALILPMPSPGNSPYELNFFQCNFTGGGTIPPNLTTPAAFDTNSSPALVGLIMIQHADCASFDIDRAPKTTPTNRDLLADGFSQNGTISDGLMTVSISKEDTINGFKEEDSNYFLDPLVWRETSLWENAANFGYTKDDSRYDPQPRIGANPDIVDSPRFRMVCNIGCQILPAPNSEVYAADSQPAPPLVWPNPDPLLDFGREGLAANRVLTLITGPLSWSWNLIKE